MRLRRFRWTLITAGVLSSIVPVVNASPVEIMTGSELMRWQEQDVAGGRRLEEQGTRYFVALEGENSVSERWTYGFRGRIYSGAVACKGWLKNGTACQYDSDYDGIAASVDFVGRFRRDDGDYSNWGLLFALGGEEWRHHLTGVNGYSERYSVVLGRLGIAYLPQQGWFGSLGGNYPLVSSERVALFDGVKLSPQGRFSLFARMGYRFNQHWSIHGYYDSYRFSESDAVTLTAAGVPVGVVQQPNSELHRVGIAAGLYF